VTLPVSPDGSENVMVSPAMDPTAPVTVAVHVAGPDMSTSVGLQLIEVVVAASTVTVALPKLSAFFVSPAYVAWMVTGPGFPPVIGIEQLLPERVHEEMGDAMFPDSGPSAAPNCIVSPEISPVAPDTVAVH
jgi:hypothetical protein